MRVLDILKFQIFVLHNTESVSLDKTADDMQETRDDNGCDDAEEEDDNEDEEHGEGRAAPGVQRKRRQERSFYFTTDQISTQKRQGGP